MKRVWRWAVSMLLVAAMVLSLPAGALPARAAGSLPTEVSSCETGGYPEWLRLSFDDESWMSAVNKITVNGTEYTETTDTWGAGSDCWLYGSYYGAYGSVKALQIVNTNIDYPATILAYADDYPTAEISVSRTRDGWDYTYSVEIKEYTDTPDPDPTPTPDPDPNPEPTPDPETKTIQISQISVSSDMFGQTWYLNVSDDDEYVGKITGVQVNDNAWEVTSYLSSGGKYLLRSDENRIELARMNFGSSGPDVIKSGDVITITADGYNDLTLKFVVDSKTGEAYVTENDGEGDPYVLYVKLEGSFDSAITGQKYDAISGASTGVSLSKNSSVTVYGALVAKGTEPTDSDWHELEAWTSGESGIDLDSSKCRAYVVADTDKGTSEDKNSGLEGVYLVVSSDLTLSGTAQDPGDYLVYVEIADEQGRTATSNRLPVRVYSGEELLADQIVLSNMTQTQDGKYMWDMEPWAIKGFGSNVTGESESVRVPEGLKAWYGSHTSGTYGYLGYDLAWKEVEAGNIPQTLYIPSGCDLTLVNMEILSSVRIVIEDGGRLTLRDSVVQGIIDVQSGGTFSMNYDSYSGQFLTGASVCGQIRLQDGAILENAAIYSHANYLANGDRTDRTTTEPVVTTTGNVTIKGDVYIQGDAAGRDCGQTGLLVKDGTLTVGEGSTLVVIGGESMNGWDGGTAIRLDNGKITGEGKLVAIGGESGPVQGDGGDAVSGNGTISTDQTFLRGATAYEGIAPGKAIASGSNIKIDSPSKSVEDGVYKDLYGDPYGEFYWREGIDPQPPLDQYVLDPVTRYTVTIIKAENGKVTASQTRVRANDKVTLTTEPDDGYELQSLQVVDENSTEILSWTKDSRAVRTDSFLMPASNVTVRAEFTRQADSGDKDVPGPGDDSDKGDKDPGDQSDSKDQPNSDKQSDSSGSHRHSGSSRSGKSSGSTVAAANANGSATIAESGAVTNAAGITTTTGADGANAADATTEQGAADAENGHIIATGDDMHMNLWLTIMVISAAALVAAAGHIRKNANGR